MIKAQSPALLREAIELLVKHFGVQRVLLAVEGVAGRPAAKVSAARQGKQSKKISRSLSIADELHSLKGRDLEKYEVIQPFYVRLRGIEVLKESQDIRHFAQNIGVKEIKGKSRKELSASLVRALIGMSVGRIKSSLSIVDNISAEQRQLGFSILTEKLVEQ